MIGTSAVRAAKWLVGQGIAHAQKNPRVRKAVAQTVEVAQFIYFDMVKGAIGKLDSDLAGAMTILKDMPDGETRYILYEPKIEEVLGAMKTAGIGFVIFKSAGNWWCVKRVDKKIKFSAAETLLRMSRMQVFVSCYRQKLPPLPNNADFYWVRGGGRGIIFSADSIDPLPTVVFFKSPQIKDSSVPFFRLQIPQKEIGLKLTAFVEAHTL